MDRNEYIYQIKNFFIYFTGPYTLCVCLSSLVQEVMGEHLFTIIIGAGFYVILFRLSYLVVERLGFLTNKDYFMLVLFCFVPFVGWATAVILFFVGFSPDKFAPYSEKSPTEN